MPAMLATRLAALERAHRRLQRLVVALVLALLATALLAAGDDGVIEGRTLKLVDAAGKVRILANAASGLSFLDGGGVPRAILGQDAEGMPGLVLYGEGSRAILNVNHDGPALAFTGPRGALRALLAVVRGDPALVLYADDDRERAQFSVRAGAGQASLASAAGDTAWRAPGGGGEGPGAP
jgi:hypothetical protein